MFKAAQKILHLPNHAHIHLTASSDQCDEVVKKQQPEKNCLHAIEYPVIKNKN